MDITDHDKLNKRKIYQNAREGAGEKALWVKVFTAKPDDPNSVPRPHMVDREN